MLTEPSVSADSDATEIRLAMEMVKTLDSDFSRDDSWSPHLPELLRMLGGELGGLVIQQSGAWNREIWVGEEVRIPELLIGEAVDQGTTRIADGWCVTPLSTRAPAMSRSPNRPPPRWSSASPSRNSRRYGSHSSGPIS